ncbi:MAG: 30S ribosomal protein S6--L-glutamate ligase [Thermoplasmata archaeon]|nr:30S ribosomal protein S6--L-glutamate ligase [Thermoplasmata archaeon]|tara:strand:+ start:9948 stop:10838 length:891 start_codon:yes stop_codon:yes gene_type:complete
MGKRLEIVIMTRGPELYSTTRLAAAARRAGHGVSYLNPTRCTIDLSKEGATVLYNGDKIVQQMDCIVPRIGASITRHGLTILRQFQAAGIKVLNHSNGIAASRDKLRALQRFAASELPIPRTAYARGAADLHPCIETVGGPPVVLKLLEGTQGIGVMRCDTVASAESVIDVLARLHQPIIVQEYIGESNGSDIRAIVVGEKVVAAMKRTGKSDDFRSNLHRGGTGENVDLSPEIQQMCIDACKSLRLKFAGVDLLESKRGPLLMEVNSSPGLEGIERATGVDIANEVIREIEMMCE